MAWTTPRTWTDGELVTAAIMNTHIKANQDAMAPHLIVRKSADEAISNTTVQDDNHLILPVGANATWLFKLVVLAFGTGDWKWGFSQPASAVTGVAYVSHTTAGATTFGSEVESTTPIEIGSFNVAHATLKAPVAIIDGYITTVGTAGNWTLQWACDSAGTTTVAANSTLWAVQLA